MVYSVGSEKLFYEHVYCVTVAFIMIMPILHVSCRVFGKTLHHVTLLPYMAACDFLLFPKLKVKSYGQENVIRQLMVVLEEVLTVCFEKVKDTGHFKDTWLPLFLVWFVLCVLILDGWLFSRQPHICWIWWLYQIKLNLDFEKIELQISCTSNRLSFGNQFWMRPSSKK